jgi:cobalt-zinc-cadmium efflux system protein
MWAANLAARPAVGVWTFGVKRAEILSAALNGLTSFVISWVVLFEAIRRLIHPGDVAGGAVIAISALGIVVNLVASWVLAKANRSSLNVEGAFQHIVTDALTFIATFIAGLIIVLTGFKRADSIASLSVVVLMLRAAYQLLKASGRVLLETPPEGVDLADLR